MGGITDLARQISDENLKLAAEMLAICKPPVPSRVQIANILKIDPKVFSRMVNEKVIPDWEEQTRSRFLVNKVGVKETHAITRFPLESLKRWKEVGII